MTVPSVRTCQGPSFARCQLARDRLRVPGQLSFSFISSPTSPRCFRVHDDALHRGQFRRLDPPLVVAQTDIGLDEQREGVLDGADA